MYVDLESYPLLMQKQKDVSQQMATQCLWACQYTVSLFQGCDRLVSGYCYVGYVPGCKNGFIDIPVVNRATQPGFPQYFGNWKEAQLSDGCLCSNVPRWKLHSPPVYLLAGAGRCLLTLNCYCLKTVNVC